MNDTIGPDYAALYARASMQAGLFTASQAHSHGVSARALAYHATTGRLYRVRRGLYRFRDYPSTLYEEVVAAWLAIGAERSIVSHETALDLHDLTDLIPSAIHLTVPRAQRGLHTPTGITLHTMSSPLPPEDVTIREGMRVTSPERTLLDLAEAGTHLEHVERGIWTACARGWIEPTSFQRVATLRGPRIGRIVRVALAARVSS